MDDQDLIRRAFAAYFRSGGGDQLMQPSRDSGVEKAANGKHYVVLHNQRGTLAVYRIRNDGMLKGLKRWPADLDGPVMVGYSRRCSTGSRRQRRCSGGGLPRRHHG